MRRVSRRFFFFNDTPTTEIYTVMNTLSLHDALPISLWRSLNWLALSTVPRSIVIVVRSEEHTSELQSLITISYAVFCLKKKKMNRSDAPARKLTIDRAAVALCGYHEANPGDTSLRYCEFFFFFNDTATTEIYTVMNTLSLHDALPI